MRHFESEFKVLTGNLPFPWQRELYARLCSETFPDACVIPTGLGKTSVIAIWFLAMLSNSRLPRRLVYVVNRRTVVDQTTDEVTRLRENLAELEGGPFHLAISTLRGQFADNREWSVDPSRPAVVCGTVDMIGSRLLFSGYGVGLRGKPLHAGFLGQDVLLVHDEAHLEEPFQRLVTAIEREQQERKTNRVAPLLRVMSLTATPRGHTDPLKLSAADREAAKDRLDAVKSLTLISTEKDSEVCQKIVELAHKFHTDDRAVLVFVNKVEDASKVADGLRKKKVPDGHIAQLTGTIRGRERDRLVMQMVFKRFLPKPERDIEGTVYLVCTSAGEVGVNISADELVCDLSTFDSMAQRFGRVNRFGCRTDSTITVVHTNAFDRNRPVEERRERTLALLKRLEEFKSVNSNALERLLSGECEAAFAPTPTILSTTDILLDAWSLTSIRGRMPGRPDVEPYLHGVAEHQPPETYVAWRKEVGVITHDMFGDHPPRELLEEYELKPHELLRDSSKRVFETLKTLAGRFADRPVWLLDDFGEVEPFDHLHQLTSAKDDTRIRNRTVLLPHDVGGLSDQGMLDGNAQPTDDPAKPVDNDVADLIFHPDDAQKPKSEQRRMRVRAYEHQLDTIDLRGMRRVRTIRWPESEDGETDAKPRVWLWYERPVPRDNSRHAVDPVLLDDHTKDVSRKLDEIMNSLHTLPEKVAHALRLAARWHDLGKQRERWQSCIGRPTGLCDQWFAKSGRNWVSRRETRYRHEFGSLLDVARLDEFKTLDPDTQDLVLHLIAAHHGMARPHFEAEQILDDNHPADAAEAMATESVRRFSRLQRRFGHWGLAYIESILRAADWHASAHPGPGEDEAKQ